MATQKFIRPIFDNPLLNIVELAEDTVVRKPEPLAQPNSDPNGTSLVMSKDVDLDINKKTWLRIYVPRRLISDHGGEKKLPVVFYYHGGGFVFFHADSIIWDDFCQGLADKVGAMVVNLEYRLTPENRLPAAYDDAIEGLHWLRSTQDEWVRNYSDLSNVYLFGSSAGGNLAYHAGLRAATKYKELEPVKIKGLILHQPYFSGKKRTESEENLKDDQLLPLHSIDKMFDLSLPKGTVDHDHEYSNPFVNGGSKLLDDIVARGWGVLVTGVTDDPLFDAARNIANLLEEKGIKTFKHFGDGYHAIEAFEPSMAAILFDATKNFISATKN